MDRPPERLPYRLIGQDRHGAGQRAPVLLAYRDFLAPQEYTVVVERRDLLDRDYITPMDAAELVPGQQPVPLFEGDQHQYGRTILLNEPRIVFARLDVQDVPEFHFHILTFMTDKEK